MSIIDSITVQRPDGTEQRVRLADPEIPGLSEKYQLSLITGQNGSCKSSTLMAIVKQLVIPKFAIERSDSTPRKHPQVLCVSGSAADRFPHKLAPGGRRTEYDVPHYAYVGQRVMPNLLSKKAPAEQMLMFALDERKASRFSWDFFIQAHDFAGVTCNTEITIRRPKVSKAKIDTLKVVQNYSKGEFSTTSESRLPLSEATASWILEEFAYDEFLELDAALLSKFTRPRSINLSRGGVDSKWISSSALRLGLHLELFKIEDIIVRHKSSGAMFSAFDLSSGEYQMYTTLLAIGFGLEGESVLLVDEPENSLHPQWQRSLMASIQEICTLAMDRGQVVICTHSPLIVGAANEGSTVIDLSHGEVKIDQSSYGASSDELLLAQFGVGSSRNRSVVDTVQAAVSLFEKDAIKSTEFTSLLPDLEAVRAALRDEDPLSSVIDALISEAGEA